VYHADADGALRGDGVVVLAATATGISRVTKFLDPALVTAFGCAEGCAGDDQAEQAT
jgi:RNA polymerase sigma-70 factor (ECF subfamily)